MTGIGTTRTATARWRGHAPTSTSARILPARRISIVTANGKMSRHTETFGSRRSIPGGRRTGRAAGLGRIGTDGHGSATTRGAGRHITTDAGSGAARGGAGTRADPDAITGHLR